MLLQSNDSHHLSLIEHHTGTPHRDTTEILVPHRETPGASLGIIDVASLEQHRDAIRTPPGRHWDATGTEKFGQNVSGCTMPSVAVPFLLDTEAPN